MRINYVTIWASRVLGALDPDTSLRRTLGMGMSAPTRGWCWPRFCLDRGWEKGRSLRIIADFESSPEHHVAGRFCQVPRSWWLLSQKGDKNQGTGVGRSGEEFGEIAEQEASHRGQIDTLELDLQRPRDMLQGVLSRIQVENEECA